MTIQSYARALGGDVSGRNTVTCPGPGHSAKDRSLSVRFGAESPDGFVVYSFSGDDPIECRDYVKARLGMDVSRPLPQPVVSNDTDRIRYALQLWEEATEPRGTVVDAYLASRAIPLRTFQSEAIRFHPALKYEGRAVPGMVCLFRDIRTNEPCGIHRTFLDATGAKLDRRMLGRAKGAAIKLDPDEEVSSGLIIGEGVETGLSARLMGYRPCWVLGSASAIAHFPVLPGIEALSILGETGDGGVNERAAKACAGPWLSAGAEVRILEASDGDDLNALLRRIVG